jgi:hypothetical protein
MRLSGIRPIAIPFLARESAYFRAPGRSPGETYYETLYCARGQAENLIKLHKAQLPFRPHQLPQSARQPDAPDPTHRGLLADARGLIGNAKPKHEQLQRTFPHSKWIGSDRSAEALPVHGLPPRPHQALGWRTPDEAYLGQSTAASALAA